MYTYQIHINSIYYRIYHNLKMRQNFGKEEYAIKLWLELHVNANRILQNSPVDIQSTIFEYDLQKNLSLANILELFGESFMRYLGFFEIGRRKFKTTRKNTILRKKNLAYSIIVHAIIIQKMVKGKYKCQMVLADV